VQTDQERCDVVIAGGGAVGLALACALADALGPATRIAVVDRVPFGGTAGPRDIRASAVSAGSQHVLAALGIWPALAEHAEAVTAVDITDASLEDAFRPILVSYDNTVEGGEPATYIVENERLTAAILGAAMRRPSITLLGGAAATGYAADEHGVTVTLADGRHLRAPLLVAADGRASRLREAAGIGVVGWKYQQVGIVTTVSHEKPHRSRAMQHFLPSGPFAILPLKGNRSCVTWTEEEAQGRAIMALDDAGFLSEVETRFGYRLGRTQLAGPRAVWPLEMHLARAMVADRLVLVGDAAHLVHPIAGQGLNLGLRDVAALTEVVADAARLGLDIGSSIVLARYERWRRTDAALSAAAFDGLNRLFSSDWTLLRTARSAGLGIVDRLPALKQFFVAEAAGLTGEVPKLLRGERV
jgi:2-octaprenyl-6-methoxyphenol hydroxylase